MNPGSSLSNYQGLSATPIAEIESKTAQNLQTLIELLYSFGLFRKKTPVSPTNMPIALNPKRISQALYSELKANCLAFHRILELLYARREQMLAFYQEAGHGDELVQVLLRIVRKAEALGRSPSKPECVIVRNDFMFDRTSGIFQQVEFNTMSVGLGQQTSNLDRLSRLFFASFLDRKLQFAPNCNSERQVETLERAFGLYNRPSAFVLEVMLPEEPNIFDSIPNERMLSAKGIPIFRIRLNEICPEIFRLDKSSGTFYVKDKEIAVVYFRSLYDPSHFDEHRENLWAAAEASKAVLLPSAFSFLLGLKPTQLLFSSQKLLEQTGLLAVRENSFAKHFCETKHIESDFGNDREKLLHFLQQRKDSCILKSFKEGGMGVLLGGEEMIGFAKTASLAELEKLIVAHKIDAPIYESLALVDHSLRKVEESVSELSIYSSYVFARDEAGEWKVEWEAVWDYLLRSKYRSELKGGINIGASFMDTLAFDD